MGGRTLDKQGRTITIKINGKDRPLNKGERDTPQNNGDWSFSQEYDNGLTEAAAAEEVSDEDFDWILPEIMEEKQQKASSTKSTQVKNKSFMNRSIPKRKVSFNKSILFTVFFAVFLGTTFGVSILKLVTSDSLKDDIATKQQVATPAIQASGEETAALPPYSVFVVQNGIFTTVQAAEERIKELDAKGVYGGLFPMNGNFAVFLDISPSLEEAKNSSVKFKEQGLEVFSKQVDIGGGTVTNLTTKEAAFLQKSTKYFQALEKSMSDTDGEAEKLNGILAELEKVETFQNHDVQNAKKGLEAASKSMLSYWESNDLVKIDEMKQGLLQYLSAYQSLSK